MRRTDKAALAGANSKFRERFARMEDGHARRTPSAARRTVELAGLDRDRVHADQRAAFSLDRTRELAERDVRPVRVLGVLETELLVGGPLELGTPVLEHRPVVCGGPHRLALGNEEVAGKTRLDGNLVADIEMTPPGLEDLYRHYAEGGRT